MAPPGAAYQPALQPRSIRLSRMVRTMERMMLVQQPVMRNLTGMGAPLLKSAPDPPGAGLLLAIRMPAWAVRILCEERHGADQPLRARSARPREAHRRGL